MTYDDRTVTLPASDVYLLIAGATTTYRSADGEKLLQQTVGRTQQALVDQPSAWLGTRAMKDAAQMPTLVSGPPVQDRPSRMDYAGTIALEGGRPVRGVREVVGRDSDGRIVTEVMTTTEHGALPEFTATAPTVRLWEIVPLGGGPLVSLQMLTGESETDAGQ